VTIPFDSDASRAAVTVAAQRIAAFADRQGIPIEPPQCDELAEVLVHVYQAFFAGMHYVAMRPAQPEPQS
jgi:hypothetical protein